MDVEQLHELSKFQNHTSTSMYVYIKTKVINIVLNWNSIMLHRIKYNSDNNNKNNYYEYYYNNSLPLNSLIIYVLTKKLSDQLRSKLQ
jgi:hypothetical protein